jgi:hypothetical protein
LAILIPSLLRPLSGAETALALAFLVLVSGVQIALHELGHAVAGSAAGMELRAMGIGPVRWELQGRSWVARYAGWMQGLLGYVFMLPSQRSPVSRRGYALHIVGGPLMNLATAGICYWLMPNALPPGLGNTLWWLTIGSAAYFGVVNLVPFTTSGTRSDGGQLLDLILAPTHFSQGMQLQQVINMSRDGVRPRDWPVSVLPGWPELDSIASPIRLNFAYLGALRAVDANDSVAADGCARVLSESYPSAAGVAATSIALMMATYAAASARQSDLLKAWRALIGEHFIDLRAHTHWLDAEVAHREGQDEAALKSIAASWSLMSSVMDAGSRTFLEDQLDRLKRDLDATESAPPTPN